MTKKLKNWLVVAFLLLVVFLLFWFKATQPRVLVIHSYDPDYAWTRDVDTGLHRVFDSNLHHKVQWHYMNTKKHPDAEFKRRAGMLATREIERFRPDVIIAVDDDAQKYAVKEYAKDPKVRIVFGGLNGSAVPYNYHLSKNATGIYERKPLGSLLSMLSEVRDGAGMPLGKRIVHIGDRSDSVMEDSKAIESMDWTPFRLVASMHAGTLDEWKRAVLEASEKGDLILISNYQNVLRQDGKDGFVPPAELMEWTEANSRIPVVGMGGFMVEDGGMLAVGASGFEQGDVIARMTMRILDEEISPGDIPHVMPRQYLVYMRQAVMEKRGLKLPDIYEAFSRASNNYH
ncbi:MAG TPA: ABC transporter substrate binding protein [Gallionella sp.]|nr:ABC transporter substrate binding protein [Gallionella sp.]